ncbi:uncharacterized protein LOC144247163 [Lonchura striata]
MDTEHRKTLFFKVLFSHFRAKSLICFNIPTPAAFFQPLYSLHNGNFKDWVRPNEACSQLEREETSNSSKVNADSISDLNTQELISQISLKPTGSTDVVTAEENFAFASGPSQPYVPSRYIRAEEIEMRPGLLFAPNPGPKISEIIKDNLESPSVGRNYPSHSQHGKSDFLILQESLGIKDVSFSGSDYCTLCDNDTTGGLISAELLKFSNGNSHVKHQKDQ